MTIGGLASVFAMPSLAACVVVGLFIVGKILFIRLHLSLRRSGLAGETARLAHPLPADNLLPHVVVQLPVYNEGEIVKRAIKAAAALDWPKDKLHIQVCDDSTDDTARFAREAMQELKSSGVDIAIVGRSNRVGFKAGSLQAGLEKVSYQFFAIFDADYLPASDFLRRSMAVLLSDPKFAFVQARAEFLNRNENALTRMQAVGARCALCRGASHAKLSEATAAIQRYMRNLAARGNRSGWRLAGKNPRRRYGT